MQTLQSYTERNTSFVVQKSVVIQVYGACISSGIGILEACRVTGTSMGFSEQVVRRSMLISLAQNLKFLRVTILPRARAFYSACLRLIALSMLSPIST